MTFPWEIDHDVRRSRCYRRRQQGNASKRRKNYLSSGHPIWYPQYLKTKHWQRFKERWRRWSQQRCCCVCGDRRYELHHITYERVGCEELEDVVPLCRRHHARAHKREKQGEPLPTAHLA